MKNHLLSNFFLTFLFFKLFFESMDPFNRRECMPKVLWGMPKDRKKEKEMPDDE